MSRALDAAYAAGDRVMAYGMTGTVLDTSGRFVVVQMDGDDGPSNWHPSNLRRASDAARARRWRCRKGVRWFVRHPLTGKRLWQLRLELWWRDVR